MIQKIFHDATVIVILSVPMGHVLQIVIPDVQPLVGDVQEFVLLRGVWEVVMGLVVPGIVDQVLVILDVLHLVQVLAEILVQ